MDTQKGSLSLKDRLLQYQENAKKQKEYDRKQNLSVSQLDSSMTDVSKYSRASSVTNRKATTVSADMVNRLDPNLLEDFNASANLSASGGSMSAMQSPVPIYQSPIRGFRSPAMAFRSPVMSKLALSSKSAGLATRDEPELRGRFLQALANSTDEDVQEMEADPKVNFSDLRSRYLRSIFALIPDYGDISRLSKERRLAIFRDDAHKREEYVTIRDAWDLYEQKALDRLHEPTVEDKTIENQIKATETDIATQWTNLAEQVVDDILKGEGETMAEEGDDSLLVGVEAARKMAMENEHRQQYKDRAELKRQFLPFEESVNEENPEQVKEESMNGSQYNSTSSFSLNIHPEDKTENSEGDSKWAEEARLQRLAFQSRPFTERDRAYEDYEDGSDQDEYVIDQAKKLRRAYIRHLANQKDSDSDSGEDEDVDNVSKWIAESRQLEHLSRSKLQISLSGSYSSVGLNNNKFVDENEIDIDTENDDEGSGRNLNKFNKDLSSDTSDSDDSDDSRSLYLWREEALRMKEKALANQGSQVDGVAAEVEYTAEETESSFYEEVVRKAMELEKKYNQKRAASQNDEEVCSGNEDDMDRSYWLEEAYEIKAMARLKFDDPEKQAWLDEAKRQREEAAAREGEMQGNYSYINDDENDEEISLKALKLCQGNKSLKEEISKCVQRARMILAERRNKAGRANTWLEEARRIRNEALAKGAVSVNTVDGDGEFEASKDLDVEIVRKAKNLRREYIRERLKYSFVSESGREDDDIDDLSRWIEAARRVGHSPHRKKWYDDCESLGSDDGDVDGEERAAFIEAAKHLRAILISKEAQSGKPSGTPTSELDRKPGKDEADFYNDVVKKAMALERKYSQQRAAREKSRADDAEAPDPATWILEAQKTKDEFAQKRSSKSKKNSQKKKEKKKKSKKTLNASLAEGPTTLLDQVQAGTQSPRKEAGSSRSRSQWIEEARERKEKALLALKAAKEEVRARQSISTKGLSLEEKKKLRIARLQEAMERREAEAKRDLEERRKEAEIIKMARKKSVEVKKKAFYSDSSGSDEDSAQVEAYVVAGEGALEDKRRPKKKKSKERSSRRLSASSSTRNHRHRKSTGAHDEGSVSSGSLGSTSRRDAFDSGLPISPHDKLSHPSEQFGASSSESSFSEESIDHNTRGRRIPDESAYIVSTDPSSSETVCSDSSAEAARLKRNETGRSMTKKKRTKDTRKSDANNADKRDASSLTRTRKSRGQSKSSNTKSPRKSKKTGLEITDLALDSPKEDITKQEHIKSPKSRRKSTSSKSVEKSQKSSKKSKQEIGDNEDDSQEAGSIAIAGDSLADAMS